MKKLCAVACGFVLGLVVTTVEAVKDLSAKASVAVTGLLLSGMAAAQVPTGVPAAVADILDNTVLMVTAIGIGVLGIIYLISGFKWGRGAS